MKILLFCEVAYSFAILKPLSEAAEQRGWDVHWYFTKGLELKLSNQIRDRIFTEVGSIIDENYDAIFVPGNEVPYFLRGVKVQVFHGFAGEKTGHFRIRHYFDLYLTQGPYFTHRFRELQAKYKDFEVVETGWPKLDPYFNGSIDASQIRERYRLANLPLILYAPTFSRSLTSAPNALHELKKISAKRIGHIIIKFHPLMDKSIVETYERALQDISDVTFADQDDLVPLILASDLIVSDTSSVVYESLIAGKPVVTIATKTPSPSWTNIDSPQQLEIVISQELRRKKDTLTSIGTLYHPYRDGRSAERMLSATEAYIEVHGVPMQRRLSFWRRLRLHKKYGKPGNFSPNKN